MHLFEQPARWQPNRRHSTARSHGFTMIEVMTVVAVIGVLVGLLLPAIQSSRECARRMSCASNLSQIGLAVSGYHNAFGQYPVQLSGTDGSTVAGADNDRRLSIFVALIPFLEKTELYDAINQPIAKGPLGQFGVHGKRNIEPELYPDDEPLPTSTVATWPAGGPEPTADYPAWFIDLPVLRCPSDPGMGLPAFGRTNYAACLGDGMVATSTGPLIEKNGTYVIDPGRAKATDVAMRGIFVPRRVTRMSDVTDGRSQTLLLGEIATGLGDDGVRTKPVVAEQMQQTQQLRDVPELARQSGVIDPRRPNFWENDQFYLTSPSLREVERGYRWADGMPLFSGFNTILPPNREITLSVDREDSDGVLTASSRHNIGVNVCFADGAVKFITDFVDAGDSNRPTVYPSSYPELESESGVPMPSPYGIWGAMGTRASSELAVYRFDAEY